MSEARLAAAREQLAEAKHVFSELDDEYATKTAVLESRKRLRPPSPRTQQQGATTSPPRSRARTAAAARALSRGSTTPAPRTWR